MNTIERIGHLEDGTRQEYQVVANVEPKVTILDSSAFASQAEQDQAVRAALKQFEEGYNLVTFRNFGQRPRWYEMYDDGKIRVIRSARGITQPKPASPDKIAYMGAYNRENYKQINLRLKPAEDADILADIERAQAEGKSLRTWLREIWDKSHN